MDDRTIFTAHAAAFVERGIVGGTSGLTPCGTPGSLRAHGERRADTVEPDPDDAIATPPALSFAQGEGVPFCSSAISPGIRICKSPRPLRHRDCTKRTARSVVNLALGQTRTLIDCRIVAIRPACRYVCLCASGFGRDCNDHEQNQISEPETVTPSHDQSPRRFPAKLVLKNNFDFGYLLTVAAICLAIAIHAGHFNTNIQFTGDAASENQLAVPYSDRGDMRSPWDFLIAYGAASLVAGTVAVGSVAVVSFLPGGIKFQTSFIVPLLQYALVCAAAAGLLALAPSVFALWLLRRFPATWPLYAMAGGAIGACSIAMWAAVPGIFGFIAHWASVPEPTSETLAALLAAAAAIATLAGACGGVAFWFAAGYRSVQKSHGL